MSARTVVITEGLIGELLKSGPYQECQGIARQLCPRKHHVYPLAIFPTHRNTTPLNSTREKPEECLTLLPNTRSEEMVEQNTRTRKANAIAGSSTPHTTSVLLSTTARHARDRPVGP